MSIIISGMSGSGKSTVGQALAKKLNIEYIDQDSYYKKEKPEVILSNGIKVKNWDTLEALDMDEIRIALGARYASKFVFVGFAPIELGITTDYHFHLVTGSDETSIINRCINARKRSKGFNNYYQMTKDEFVVKELVYPFQQKIMRDLKNRDIKYISVFNDNSYRDVDGICYEIIKHIN